MTADLEGLYQDAKAALKARDFGRASDLFRQILVVDENYKDASRLLAQSVRLKRRRWYNDPRVSMLLGAVALIALGILLAPQAQNLYGRQLVRPTASPTGTLAPTVMATTTATLLPTPTPIPLTWKRIASGQEFERDTVTAFAADKTDPDVIYASMKNAGVYKTIDGGLSWRPAHHGLASTQVDSLLIDPQDPRILYAGTIGGVFKTEDSGENWFRVGNGTYLLMDTKDNSHLYAHDEDGIYETTDRGNTWKTTYALKKHCPDTISSWAIHPANANVLFIGGRQTCSGVYQSGDRARNWAPIGLEDKPNGVDALAVGLDKQGNLSIYASVSSPVGVENGLFSSNDGGISWSFSTGNCAILTSDADNPGTVYCHAGSSLRVIRGKGYQWRLVPGSQSRSYSAIHIDAPSGAQRIITGATNVASETSPYVAIFISEDGGHSWSERISGIGSAWAELSIDPKDDARIFLATYYVYRYVSSNTACTLYRSIDRGTSWSSLKPNATWCGPTFDAAHVLYMNEGGRLQESRNGGDTWRWSAHEGSYNRNTGFSTDPTLAFALPSLHMEGSSIEEDKSVSANPYLEDLVYDAGDVISFSADAGATWQPSQGSEGSWDARLFYAEQGKMIYAIGRYHQSYSVDSGKTWQSCGADVTTSRSDSRLAIDLQSSRLYLATPGNGVLISTDRCRSWQASSNRLSNLFVNTLAVDSGKPEIVYAGTDGGAYVSFDSGRNWGQINDGLLGATVVYSLAVGKDSNVYAATPYGIFKLEGK